jgi:hypothetical protein
VAIEATYCWYWAVDVLRAAGFEVHLAHRLGMRRAARHPVHRSPTANRVTADPTGSTVPATSRPGTRFFEHSSPSGQLSLLFP